MVASRIIPRVCSSLIRHYPISCIDGVLFAIQTSHEDEASYVCREGFHAINVQAIADADLRFINIVVKWPGATHDSFILANSCISENLSRRSIGWLLGDSGYPLKSWLMTPYLHPFGGNKQKYNMAHARKMNVVERSFGVLKARFRCLDRSGGHLCYQPKKAVQIIAACFSLHKLATEKKMLVPSRDNDDDDDNADEHNVEPRQSSRRAQELRDHLARSFEYITSSRNQNELRHWKTYLQCV